MSRYSSFDSDWDVEQYRHFWDSDDQWEVRRQFMLAHKSEMPEKKLVCLAQVYANIEFLQCSYPAEVMQQVKALSAGLNETTNEKRKQKQNIGFVKGGKRSPSEHDNKIAKYSRWEMPADSNLPPNRPTASSYFESTSSSKPADDILPAINSSTTETQSQYSMQQSYYTSTYYNRLQNPSGSETVHDNSRGPGTHDNYIPVSTDCFSHSNISNYNDRSNQNLVSITTTLSGKDPASDGIFIEQEKKFKRLVKLLSNRICVGNLDFFHKVVSKAKLSIRYEWQKTTGQKKKNPLFISHIYLDNILVFSSEPVNNKHAAKVLACKVAIEKLRNSKPKIIRNDAGQLELIFLNSGIMCDADHCIEQNTDHSIEQNADHSMVDPDCIFHDAVTVPGPLKQKLPSTTDLTMARTYFKNFVLVEYADKPQSANPIGILHNSAQLNGRHIVFSCFKCPTSTMPSFWRCLIKIHNIAVGEGTGIKSEDAKRAAAEAALEFLQSVSYTLVVKHTVMPGRHVSKDDFDLGEVCSKLNAADVAISDDNVGNKLLRLMGWSGSGGLGKLGRQGISEPIRATEVRGREGFGLASTGGTTKEFRNRANAVIGEYASKKVAWDLVFSAEFSKDERVLLHKIASKRYLKSCSRGKGLERFLVISHRVNRFEIIEQLIKDGGSNEKYMVRPPRQF